MPFTLSHPAAALLLKRTGLPLSAVVAGSMAPDLPTFLGTQRGYRFTHSALGVVTVDVVIAMTGLALWFLVCRDALVDTSPGFVRERVAPAARLTRRQWLLAPLGVVAGSITHVVWDAFTHGGRWGVRLVPWLQQQHAGGAGYHWAQYVSGLVGGLIVVTWALLALRALPRRPTPARVPSMSGRPVLGAVVAATVVGGGAALAASPHGLHAVAFTGAVIGCIVLGLGLVAGSVVWRLLLAVERA